MIFSIVTAAFQAEAKIARCVRSVKEQNHADLEHLLIDNRSSDSTVERARCENRNLIVVSEPDLGIYDAMNKGIRLASGEIVACLNADDAYLPGALDAVAAVFTEYPDVDLVHGNIQVNGRIFRPASGMASFGGARIFHPATFIRKRLLDRIGLFDDTFHICADLDLFLRAKEMGAVFYHLDRVLTEFSLGGVSTRQRQRTSAEIVEILKRHGFSLAFRIGFYLCSALRSAISRFRISRV